MATETLPSLKPARSSEDRNKLLWLPIKLMTWVPMAMGLFGVVAPLVIGKPFPQYFDPIVYMVISALGAAAMGVLGAQELRIRELERLLEVRIADAEPGAGSDGGWNPAVTLSP
jgi:hypothetical protein